MRLFILLCLVVSNLVYWSFAKASEPNLPAFKTWRNHQTSIRAEMIRYLVANGANVNARNKKGLTPMQLSFNNKDREFLRSLGGKLLQGLHGR
jgi:hypothetical protein